MKIDLTLNVGTVNQISEAAALKKKSMIKGIWQGLAEYRVGGVAVLSEIPLSFAINLQCVPENVALCKRRRPKKRGYCVFLG